MFVLYVVFLIRVMYLYYIESIIRHNGTRYVDGSVMKKTVFLECLAIALRIAGVDIHRIILQSRCWKLAKMRKTGTGSGQTLDVWEGFFPFNKNEFTNKTGNVLYFDSAALPSCRSCSLLTSA